jgi:transposase
MKPRCGGKRRRTIRAVAVSEIRPVAHLPLVLGMLRKLDVATIIDRLLPPHPDNVLSCGRGVEALVLAILDGHHALYKVGARVEERGILPLLQEGLARESLNDYRLGQILDAVFAANLNRVFSVLALKALDVYTIPTPWLHQDTTTIALYGAYAGSPERSAEEAEKTEQPVAPRPAHGQSKDGRPELKQVLLSLGVSGDGGLPLRLGLRHGNTSDSTETPVAIAECLALGLEGVIGIVADSKAYSQRTLGLCIEKQIGLVTLVPRTCAVRQELEVWGRQQPAFPLLLEKPGRTQRDAPRYWHGQSVVRRVDVEYADGRVAQEEVRFVVVHSSPLAQQEATAYATAQAKEAERVADHVKRVAAKQYACAADAEAAMADYEGRGPGRRGRRPQLWRYHTLRYRVEAFMHHPKRTRRGRPPKGELPQEEVRYRLVVNAEAETRAAEDNGWTVLATTVGVEGGADTAILQAYHEQHPTVEPGFRWIKNPAAITPVWLEKPERIAALAMLTVVGLLVYALIQRQVRLYLHTHCQHIPGNKGPTALPTAAVVLSLFAQVMMVHIQVDNTEVLQVYRLQEHHGMICDALGVDRSWYGAPSTRQNHPITTTPP